MGFCYISLACILIHNILGKKVTCSDFYFKEIKLAAMWLKHGEREKIVDVVRPEPAKRLLQQSKQKILMTWSTSTTQPLENVSVTDFGNRTKKP